MSNLSFLFLLSFQVTLGADTREVDWPQWRGPSRDGNSQGSSWPVSLDELHLKSLWKVDLQPSYSGPIIDNAMVYTTESGEGDLEVVRAFRLGDGSPVWKASWEGVMRVPFFARKNGSWIRSTPASDGKRIYVAGMRDVLVCLDAVTGKEIWRMNFVEELGTPLPDFGFVCSPLLTNRAVVVQAGASLVALEKESGKILWRTLVDAGGMNGSAFSSPYLGMIAGEPQLLVQTRTELCGVDVEKGTVLWRRAIPAFRGMNILTPTVHDDLVFTASYGGKALGLKLERDDMGVWKPETAWEIKAQGYMSSPVVVDGLAYLMLRNQRVACIDLERGELLWETKEKFGKYWSLIARGRQILALDEEGALLLIDVDRNGLQVRSRRDLGTKDCWAHLALSGDRLIVRSLNRLEVFEWKAPKA